MASYSDGYTALIASMCWPMTAMSPGVGMPTAAGGAALAVVAVTTALFHGVDDAVVILCLEARLLCPEAEYYDDAIGWNWFMTPPYKYGAAQRRPVFTVV